MCATPPSWSRMAQKDSHFVARTCGWNASRMGARCPACHILWCGHGPALRSKQRSSPFTWSFSSLGSGHLSVKDRQAPWKHHRHSVSACFLPGEPAPGEAHETSWGRDSGQGPCKSTSGLPDLMFHCVKCCFLGDAELLPVGGGALRLGFTRGQCFFSVVGHVGIKAGPRREMSMPSLALRVGFGSRVA